MLIFKFTHGYGEMDYVAAETMLQSIVILCETQDIDISELGNSQVIEFKSKFWDDVYLSDEEGSSFPNINSMEGKTLRDWINENNYPDYIAGTNN